MGAARAPRARDLQTPAPPSNPRDFDASTGNEAFRPYSEGHGSLANVTRRANTVATIVGEFRVGNARAGATRERHGPEIGTPRRSAVHAPVGHRDGSPLPVGPGSRHPAWPHRAGGDGRRPWRDRQPAHDAHARRRGRGRNAVHAAGPGVLLPQSADDRHQPHLGDDVVGDVGHEVGADHQDPHETSSSPVN
jgi:hypothetical protein